MKTNRFVFPMVLVLTILVPLCASAQNEKGYLTAKPGLYSPQASDRKDFDTGFNGEIALGYQPNPNFAAEMGLGYFNTKVGWSEAGRVHGIRYRATAEGRIEVVPVTLTLKGIYPIDKWELFVLGGIGGYFVFGDLKAKIKTKDLSISGTSNETDTIFGGHLGLGVHYNITPTLFVGVEGKYLWTRYTELEREVFNVRVEREFNLEGIQATAVLGVRF